jgi:hypothetical protein
LRTRPQLCVHALALLSAYFVLSPLPIAGQNAKPELAPLPLAFESNLGQAPALYQFVARRGSMQTFFSAAGVDVVLTRRDKTAPLVHITWKGADPAATLAGDETLPGHSNYLRGADPAKWLRDIPEFAQIRYTNIYPNIDLVFHGRGDTLEHDFVLRPGGEASQIALRIDGRKHIDELGDLIVELDEGELRLMGPTAYQLMAESKTEVSAKFVIARNGEVGFEVGKYDHGKPLTIDPVFVFSTYLDGSMADNIAAVTTDSSGNVYVTGYTNSPDFPATNAGSPLCSPCSDVNLITEGFVSKLDPTGHTLVYSTYLGGSNSTGGFGTFPSAIGLDKNGNVYIAGTTSSWDFPHAGAVLPLAPQFINGDYYFVSSLKPDGSEFNYSGLVGGEQGFYTDGSRGELAIDAAGNAYLAGTTYDPNFQLTPGTLNSTPTSYANDTMFVLKLDVTGNLVYSTLVPGNVPRPVGTAYADNFVTHGIAVDANGQVTAAGLAGIGLPTTAGVVQATFPNATANGGDPTAGFVLQLNATASKLNFATYLTGTDTAHGMAVDASGDFYVVGMTSESNLPVAANAYQKAIIPSTTCTCNAGYVLKLDPQAKTIPVATYLAGPSGAALLGVALDSKGNVTVGGAGFGADFPLKNPFVTTYEFTQSIEDTVLAQLKPDLSSLLFGSYLSSTTYFPYPGSNFAGLAVDPTDKVLVVGTTYPPDFPTTSGSYQTTPPPASNPLAGYVHSFVSKLDLSTPAPSVCLATTSINFGAVLVGTSGTLSLDITNCGNAALQISSITSSLASVVPAHGCASISAGASCNLQLTFTPADTTSVQGTLTLTDNAAIPQQTVTVGGKGGLPQIVFPPVLEVGDLLVGTHAESSFFFSNEGDGAWIVGSVTASGDFSVDNNNKCSAPVPPLTGFCTIGIIFAPTQVGLRTGTLTITDNAAGSPHVIAISGNALSAYPTPSITGITAVAMDAPSPTLQIVGTNFFPASQVMVNGSQRTATYINESLVLGTLVSGDVAKPGELTVTVANPTPGGGASNAFTAAIYNAIRNIGILHVVYDAKSGHIYASVSTSSQNYANQVVVIDPAMAKVLSSWSLGNGPNQLAISDDQQFLYVGLDGDKKVAQVALPAGTINFATGLGNEPTFQTPMVADALRVLPGLPHSWAVTLCATSYTPCGNGVAVFDDAQQRATVAAATQLQPDSLVFVGHDATTLYGTTLNQGPPAFYEFKISSTGITLTQTAINYAGASPGGGTLDSDGTSIYVSNGQVIDPSTLNIKSGGFSPLAFMPAMRVDVPSSRVYFAGQGFQGTFTNAFSAIEAFDLKSQQATGSVYVAEFLSSLEMYRWGTDGLEVGANNAMLFFQTSIASNSLPTPQFFVSSVTPMVVPAGSPDLLITINGGGLGTGDTVTANGGPLSTSGVSSSQITATIPASVLSVPGVVQLAVTDTANHTGNLEMVISPGNANVGLSTNVVNFAAQNVGTTSSADSVTLTNKGSSALVISGVVASGDFSQTNNCTTVTPAASCTISVTFTPSSVGTRSGVLNINDNDPSKSQTITLSGIGSDIQITAGTAGGVIQTVKTGATATFGLAATPQSGFTGTLNFSCSNLPAYASCTFNPATATVGTSSVNVTVTISTQQQQTAALYPGGLAPSTLAGSLACVLLLSLVFGPYRKGLRQNVVVRLLVFALVLLPLAGCGGGGSMSMPTSTPLYTPTGTYTVTFTATNGAFSRSIPLTLIVTN